MVDDDRGRRAATLHAARSARDKQALRVCEYLNLDQDPTEPLAQYNAAKEHLNRLLREAGLLR